MGTTIEKVFKEIYDAVVSCLHPNAEITYRLFEDGIHIIVNVPRVVEGEQDCYVSAVLAWETVESAKHRHVLSGAVSEMCQRLQIGMGKVRYEDWVRREPIEETFPEWDDLAEGARNPWCVRSYSVDQAVAVTRAVLAS